MIIIAFPFISTHFPSRTFVSFQLLSCPSHILSMSLSFPFFPFHVIQVAREIPKSKNYTSFLLNHQFKKYLDQTLSHLGTGIPHKSPKKQISKGSRESFSWFFSSRLSAFHFLTCAFSSVSFMLSISFSCPFMI